MPITLDMHVNLDRLNEIIARFPAVRDAILHETADDVLRDATENIIAKDIIDTGELLNSGVVEPETATSYLVRFPTDHSIYPEFGTIHQPARPYLSTAIESNRDRYVDRWRELAERSR